MNIHSIRSRIWGIVEVAAKGDRASRIFDICLMTLIGINVVSVVIETVEPIRDAIGTYLSYFETVSVICFSLEYAMRVWTCTVDGRFGHPITGRIRFALTPLAIVDLVSILPFYLPFVGLDLRVVRILRIVRIARIVKIGRYFTALQIIKDVIVEKREELGIAIVAMALLMILSASLMYFCEHPVQPDAFPSIPATFWWSIVTITTVGYGEVVPITVSGKIIAAIISVLGIGMFALPTGILGAGFVEALQKRKPVKKLCPHCGAELNAVSYEPGRSGEDA